ncbi:outer membrane beta-barrel family protein [Flavobacterium paronense]|uniref:TonB-dependent receptor domain-containing protein n=1 Tax=Flavobacterium paronense TaxID=1392775 RepID=A0ABV5GD30_9FLAO|nr:outer membrane beta-barrel family protein [Flavobacterium paronense]MDN3676144.1 outer membrane beta-barrel family protein [Flavobacterium paronense]
MKSLSITLCLLATSFIFAQEAPTKSQETPKTNTTEKTNELSEVTVYGNKKQYIKVESDKTTINVRDNAMLNSGSSMEAVKKIPGVITSPSGSITLNSKGVSIYIDGAPSSLSGTDLQNYLATLPANAIEKVELIYNPGASYDASSSGSIINIITSTKRKKGINASFNINYNFNKYQKPSPQILLNGKVKNLSWQTMVGYNYIDGEIKTKNDQVFTSFNPNEHLIQKNLLLTTNRNFYFRTGTNYKLSEKSNLLFNYNLNLGNDRFTNNSSTVGTGIDYANTSLAKNKNNNHELSLQYKTKLDTIGRTLDITTFSNFFDKKPITKSIGFDNGSPSYFNGDVDFKLTNYYLKYDFAIPFNKINFSLNTGGKYNTIKVTDKGIYNFNSATNSVTNFDYTEDNLAFYVEARKKIKKFNFTAGIRFEDYKVDRKAIQNSAETKVNFKNTNFFPNVSALYEFNDNINLSASYSKKIQQANYNTLDPNNFANFDQYNSSNGNPFLDPTFFDNFELKLTAFQFVSIGGNYSIAKDSNRFIFDANPGELVSNQTFKQFDEINTLSLYASFPIPLDYFLKGKEEFNKRMNNMDKMNYIFFNINYIKFDTQGYNFSFDTKPIWSYAAQAQFILPWEIKNTMSYNYTPPGTWEIYNLTKTIQQFDISFNRDFLNKNLKIGLHCFDVFNTNEINATVSSTNLQSKFYKKEDSRTFRISLTYNFGNLSLKKDNTDIDVDKTNSGGGFLK